MGHHHLRDVRLDDAGDGEGIARALEGDFVVGAEVFGEPLERFRCSRNPWGRADAALLADRHLAEVPMNVESDEPHPPSFPGRALGDGWADDTYGCVRSAQPGRSQGTIAGSRPIEIARPAQPRSPPEAPVQGKATLRPRPPPRAELQGRFMPVRSPTSTRLLERGQADRPGPAMMSVGNHSQLAGSLAGAWG
jgi:hypothetical protein